MGDTNILGCFKDEKIALSFVLINAKEDERDKLLGVDKLKGKPTKDIQVWYQHKRNLLIGTPYADLSSFILKDIYKKLIMN